VGCGKIADQLQTMFVLTNKPIVSLNPKELTDHPLNKKLFGVLSDDEYNALKEDIDTRGIQDALHVIKKENGKYLLISGHQRKNIAKDLGINTPCIVRDDLKEDWQVEEQLISDNLLRRHLTDPQIGEVGKYLEPIEKKRAEQRQKEHGKTAPGKPRTLPLNSGEVIQDKHGREAEAKVAKKLGIKRDKYHKIKTVRDKAPKDIKQQWNQEIITTHTAYVRTNKHKRKQERKKKQEKQEASPVAVHTTDKNIKNMDCIEFLKTIKKNSIDLVLTDPPYTISKKTGFIKMSESGVDRLGVSMDFGEWDKNFKDLDKILYENKDMHEQSIKDSVECINKFFDSIGLSEE